VRKDRLGESLVALGRITEQDFERASALMRVDRKLRFGQALVRSGVMSESDVGQSVARWVEKVIVSLFGMQGGIALFDERECPIPLNYTITLSTARLLYLGIKAIKRSEIVMKGLGDLDRPVRLADAPPFCLELDGCSPEEREILTHAASPATLRRLASKPGGDSRARFRAAYALYASGVLEDAGCELKHLTTKVAAPTAAGASPARPTANGPAPDTDAAARVVAASASKSHVPRPVVSPSVSAHAAAPAPTAPRLVPHPEPVVAAAPGPEPAPPIAAAPTHAMELEHLTIEAQICMSVADYRGAGRSFNKLTQLQPRVAAHHAGLAAALARCPETARQAEREFLEALRLDPDNADLHFQAGLYYKAMAVRSRAISAFRTVLRLRPDHVGARQQLQAGSSQVTALSALKKLLEKR